MREVAGLLFGRGRVQRDYYPDGDLRQKAKRRIVKARKLMAYGYRDIAAGRRARLDRPLPPWARHPG